MEAAPSDAPLLVYDGECDFCQACVEYGRRLTRDRVKYAPFQEAAAAFPEIPLERFRAAVQLIFPDGEVASGAEAVFRTLAHAGELRGLLWAYRRVPGFGIASEAVYRWVARHRGFLWRLARRLGRRAGPELR